jgi:hypothetical protein
LKGRPIVALVFVVLLGMALSLPLRDAAREPDPKPGTTEKEKKKKPKKSPSSAPADDAELAGAYPEECLQAAPDPTESLVAFAHEDGIAIAEVPGEARAVIDDTFPYRWSPSGTLLITGSGTVYDANGEEVDSLFDDPSEFHNWGWSPVADCAVVTTKVGTLDVVVPGESRETLLDRGTAGFTFSPAGGALAYLVENEDGSSAAIWVASLADGTTERLASFELDAAGGEQIVLVGWTPDASSVLYWRGSQGELAAAGSDLVAVSGEGDVVELDTVVAHRDFVGICGKKLVAVIGGGARSEANSKRLAYLEPTAPTDFLTESGAYEISPSCAPGGDSIAAIRDESGDGTGRRRLALLDRFGSPVRFPTDDPNFDDAYPLWSRDGNEVLFVRVATDDGATELWHMESEGDPEATGLVLADFSGNPDVSRNSWGHWIDWNSDAPTSVSLVSGGS